MRPSQRPHGRMRPSPTRATLSGFAAIFSGIGLARFAYTPLLPAIIREHWFGATSAAYLGAANLAGYLLGALATAPVAKHLSARALLRAMMVLATMAILCCAWPLGFAWFFGWRLVSGIAGGVLMILAAPTVLSVVPASRRGLVSGLIFLGVGLGIATSGSLVPLLLREGLRASWLGLAGLSCIATVVAWSGWPPDTVLTPKIGHGEGHAVPGQQLLALCCEYALIAVGLVPHMIFLVDYVARGLGQGVSVGAEYWVVFGIGALAGPLLAGRLADRIGFAEALRLAILLLVIAVPLPILHLGTIALSVSSAIVGAGVSGVVPLVLGRVHELLPHHPMEQRRAWSRATLGFALAQAVAAYAMSYLLGRSGGDYAQLFAMGGGAVLVALGIHHAPDVFSVARVSQRGPT